MKVYILLLFFLITSCNAANKDEALFRELAERAIQGDMHSLLRIQQEFPERWEQMQRDGNKEKEAQAKQDENDRGKVSSIKEIFGYDLSLDLESFKIQHKDLISDCKETYHGRQSFPSVICHTKDGDQFEFAGHDKLKIVSLHKNLEKHEMLASDFHRKIIEKTGLNLKYSKYDIDLKLPFYKGNLQVNYREKKVGNEFISFTRDAWYVDKISKDALEKEWSQKKLEELSNKTKDVDI